ncbi:MAG: hypothetical protein LBD91_06375 [Prevotellaceae bacterium]|jgi:hypothetical protein|nr:hypothetical protein [Prevotellaceae bacterium]
MKQHLLYILLLAVLICMMLAQWQLIPTWAYSIPGCRLAIYFWPVKFIPDTIRQKGVKAILTSLLSNNLYTAMLTTPIMLNRLRLIAVSENGCDIHNNKRPDRICLPLFQCQRRKSPATLYHGAF